MAILNALSKNVDKKRNKSLLLLIFLIIFFSPVLIPYQNYGIVTAISLEEDLIDSRNFSPENGFTGLALVSSWDINYGEARHISMKGDLAFVSAWNCFLILNISDPEDVIPIYTFDFDSNFEPGRAAYTDDYVFFPVYDLGVYIFDIRNSSSIYLIHHIDNPTYYQSIDVEGNYLYVNNPFYPDVKIYDITTITNPVYLGHYDGEEFLKFDVEGNYLYGMKSTDIIIVDVSTPSSPTYQGTYTRGDRDFNDLVVSGDYCYIAAGTHGVHIVNILSKTTPTFSGEYYDGDSGYAYSLCYESNYVYLAEGYNCLEIIDVTNRASPSEVGDYAETGEWVATAISGDTVILCGTFTANKLILVDVTTKNSADKLGEFSMGGLATGVWVENDYVFVCNLLDGLNVLDVSEIWNPTFVSKYNDGGGAFEVYVDEDIIYLAAYFDGFRMINWSNPASLQEIYADSTLMDDTRGVTVANDYAFVIDQTFGLYVFDVSDTGSITQVDHFYDDGAGHNVFFQDDILYLANGFDGLYLLDASNPNNIKKLSEFSVDCYTKDVFVIDDIAYVADENLGVMTFNVSDENNPVSASIYSGYFAQGVVVNDSLMYAAVGNDGLAIFDVSDPYFIELVQEYDFNGYAEDVFIYGEYVFIVTGSGGLLILGSDYDSDGLADILETDVYGTDPFNSDSDSDGVTDGNEVLIYNTDPMNSDTDGDGLTDGQEINLHHTNPNDIDTDDDSYSDYDEVIAGTDPLDPDDYPSETKKFTLFSNFVILLITIVSSLAIIPIARHLKK
ncbi:MAG: hypothetical protein FK731_15050 [Asgard group archaeon]|nr:hypothetical protein [Asgard group archaeon]